MQRERLINTRPKRDLCKQEQLEVGAAKWERGSFGAKFLSAPFEGGRGYCCVFCCVYFNLTPESD